jgi:hypothetical protein
MTAKRVLVKGVMTHDAEGERVDRFGTAARTGLAGTFQELAGAIQNETSPRTAWDDLPESTQRSLVRAVEPLVNGRTLGRVLSAEDIAKEFWLNLGRTWGTGEPTPTTDTATTAGRVAATQCANERYRAQKAAAGTQDASQPVASGNKRPSVADIQARNEEYRRRKAAGRAV